VSAIERGVALLLSLYPPGFRRAHGREVLQFVRTSLRTGDARAGRLVADLLTQLVRAWFDLMRNARRLPVAPEPHPRHGEPMPNLLRDVRYACRLLVRSPGFTVAAVLTLALGIGANTAMVSLAESTLLRPLKVADPDRLVAFTWSSSYPDYKVFAERRDIFSGAAAIAGEDLQLSVDGRSELVRAAFVSGNTFGVLGVAPAVGRTLLDADDVPNGPVVAVLGHDYWARRFGSSDAAIGRTIQLNGRPATVVGVAHKGFRGTSLFSNPDVYVPATAVPQVGTGFYSRVDILGYRGIVWLNVIGRLRDGQTVGQAASAVDAQYRALHPPEPGAKPESLQLTPLTTRALGGRNAPAVRRFVMLLVGVVGMTLLIGCANLANLLLARTAARRREVGVRLAIGASRGRVVVQSLAESVVLSLVGGAAGLGVAWIALRILAAYQLPGGIDIADLGLSLSGLTLGVTAVLSLGAGLLFGAAPAWRASRTDVMGTLRSETGGTPPRGGVRSALVTAQVALSLVLLAGSGLFLRSLVHAVAIPLGFNVDGVATASVNLGLARYDAPRARAYFDAALERVRALPHVQAAAWSTLVPTNGLMMTDIEIEGYRPAAGESMSVYTSQPGPGYFEAAGTRVISGRAFTSDDRRSAPRVAIVNRAAAERFWPGRSAIGGRLKPWREDWATVVGVVEDTKVRQLDERPVSYFYIPLDQSGDGALLDAAHLFVRTSGSPGDVLPRIARELRALDPDAPVYAVTTFAERVRELVLPQRMGATLFGLFSLLAVSLAAVGVYGVTSYVTSLRRREIGVRIALGAGRAHIRAIVLRDALGPIAAGIALGVLLAAWSARFARAFLYDVSPRDPMTLAGVTALLVIVALAATWLPARRAARLDPVKALRQD
jgi:predicted permease